MKIALLQINPTVGDLAGNARLIVDAVRQAGTRGADLAVTPELALVGYLPRDLLLSAGFVRRSWDHLHKLANDLKGLPPTLIQVGSDEVLRDDAVRMADRLQAAGCRVELEVWRRMPHVWHLFAPVMPEAHRAIARIGAFVQHHA